MKKVSYSIFALALLLAILLATHPTSATIVGTVCIDSGNSTSCPPSPPTFSGKNGHELTVSVNIQGSDMLNGWDIAVKTDPAILDPASDNLTFTVFPSGTPTFLVTNCINGLGIGCAPGVDGPGIVHVAVNSPFFALAPATGRLFSIMYKIVGKTTGTTIGYQTGCTTSSNDSKCATITNGTPTPVPENVQTATFVSQRHV